MKNILWFFSEVNLTFSNQKSFYSSKKIERFFSYTLATTMVGVYFTLKMLCLECVDNITPTDICLLSGTIYAYGAYNTVMIGREKLNHTDE